jgi:uncharacterized protein YndB with AHSA1/START domain
LRPGDADAKTARGNHQVVPVANSTESILHAEGHVPASPEEVFDFLSDLGNHWLMADRFIEVVRLDGTPGEAATGGTVRMHGPLGIRRTAITRVTGQERPKMMTGTADLRGGTRARVTWSFVPDGDGTTVRLAAEVQKAGPLDRMLLTLGGKAWFRRHLATILAALAESFGR